jgi:hypothetical protein
VISAGQPASPRNFRDHGRSKTDTAMRNEVSRKFLSHNICVVIRALCELGIGTMFWPDKPESLTHGTRDSKPWTNQGLFLRRGRILR